MTLREGLRLFGYPEWFKMPVTDDEGFDLLGNTVAVNVVTAVAERLASSFQNEAVDDFKNQTKSRPVAVL
jgi:DNA (cytosine-5)-methyltransferase 1